jgi:sialate O-acetylesterase
MAVTIDIGDAGDIHPRNKRDVGRRLSLWALATVYGRDVEWSGPLFTKMERAGKDAKLVFDHAKGLTTSDGKPPAGFAVAGEDGRFVPGTARIRDGAVIVSAPDGGAVRAVRYAWANAPAEALNLVNAAGLPASPFRTDDLPGITAGK